MFSLILKARLPHLFHGFRNKYFNKILFGNMLYFHQLTVHVLKKKSWFFDINEMKNNLQNNMQITYFYLASKNIDFDHVSHVIVYM